MRIEKDKLSSIVSRRKSPSQREDLCTRKIHEMQHEIDTKLASVTKLGKNLDNMIKLREQAVRDKAAEVPNSDRVERLFNELAEAPGIIERLPPERREELINKFRRVQLLPASEASQADAAHLNAPGSSSGRPDTTAHSRPTEARNFLISS